MDGSNFIETGDKGTSALWTGERHDKSSHIFHCLGAIDEINAYLGLVIFKLKHLRQAREYCLKIEKLDPECNE